MPARTYPGSRDRDEDRRVKRHQPSSALSQVSQEPKKNQSHSSSHRLGSKKSTVKHLSSRHHSSERGIPNKLLSPPPSPHQSQQHHYQYHQESTSAQTSHSHASGQSHYQIDSTPGLPSATRWPHTCSIADRGKMDDDLLGLELLSDQENGPYDQVTRIPEEDFECALHSDPMFMDFDVVGARDGFAGYGMTEGEAIFAWNNYDEPAGKRTGYVDVETLNGWAGYDM